MNILYPFILGIITKVYDDIIDVRINISEDFIHILQSLIIMFFTLTSLGDFYFSFACCFVAFINSGFDQPFWKSLLPIAIIITFINIFNTDIFNSRFVLIKIILCLLAVGSILVLAVFEDKLFPEEVSVEKIVFRSLLIFGFIGAIIVLKLDILPLPNF